MNIKNDSISFKSKITLISPSNFKNRVEILKQVGNIQSVDFPWTAETMEVGKNIYTTKIMECLAGFIVGGANVLGYHLATRDEKKAKDDGVSAFNINNIEKNILQRFNPYEKGVHAFLLGGFQDSGRNGYNIVQTNQLKDLFKKFKIPFSHITSRRDVHYYGRYSLLYEFDKDTIYVTNSLIDEKDLSNINKEMELKDGLIEYNVYTKRKDHIGAIYDKQRLRTDIKQFFMHQFYNIDICKFDTLV